jgi:hypothetical protein
MFPRFIAILVGAGIVSAAPAIAAVPQFVGAPSAKPAWAAPMPTSPMPNATAQAEQNGAGDSVRTTFSREIPAALAIAPERQAYVIGQAAHSLANAGIVIDHPKLFLVVDRNPNVQELYLVLAAPGNGTWDVLGATHVSTGKPGRKEHFKTPIGVFLHDASILGYRAAGTYNENHIRGLGAKGMRIWDFGWQTAENWRAPGSTMQIRLEMHATDPAVLEQRIGRPDSEGCVRIPAALNKFLDHYGIIDADAEQAAVSDRRFAALLPANREPTPIAGNALVVFDSSKN